MAGPGGGPSCARRSRDVTGTAGAAGIARPAEVRESPEVRESRRPPRVRDMAVFGAVLGLVRRPPHVRDVVHNGAGTGRGGSEPDCGGSKQVWE
jgi:hypothetical protein